MKRPGINPLPIALIVSVFFLPACGSGLGEALELTESYIVPDFGFSIDYPAGWQADTRGTFTVIAELEEDFENAFNNDYMPQGYEVAMDHVALSFLRERGLPEDASLEDLFDFNMEFFGVQEPADVVETVVFGGAAISAKFQIDARWGLVTTGFKDERVFLLVFTAPSEEALDEFMPTWTKMLESIEPVEG